MKAVILCGGRGTRLAPLTDHLPKSLVEVAGKPFILWQLDLLVRARFRRVMLLTGHLGEQIRACVGERYGNLIIEYSPDGKRPLGTAGAIRQALPKLGNSFAVLYGDAYLDCDYAGVIHRFFYEKAPLLMTVVPNTDTRHRNNVLLDDEGIYYNKRSPYPAMRHIDYGLSVLSPAAVLDGKANDLGDVFSAWANRGRLAYMLMPKMFYNIGSPEGLAEFSAFVEGEQ